MSERTPSQNGRRSKDDLMTQREYADALSVTPGYVSKRTRDDGRLIKGRFDPFLDAHWENNDPENGDLLGYTDPTPRPNSNGEASPESARKAAGVSSTGGDSQSGMGDREDGRARENPTGQRHSTGQSPNGSRSQGGSGLEQALEKAGETAGREAARSPGILRGILRLGGAALGAILAANLVGRQAGPVLLGSLAGFGCAEYAIRAEQTRPQEPTRQIRPTGLQLLSRPNLPPGMSAEGGGQEQGGQFMVEKEKLARGRPIGT